MSLYDILGVKPNADDKAIKLAWRKKASKAHPDRQGGSEDAFKQIQLAYDTLSDPSKRERYDRTSDTERPKTTPAEVMVISAMSGLVGEPSFRGNYISATTKIIEKNRINARSFLKQAEAEIARLEKVLKRVKSKSRENLFESIVAEKLQTLHSKVETAELDIEQMNQAIQLLVDYEDVEAADPFENRANLAIESMIRAQARGGRGSPLFNEIFGAPE
jgi:curved DNA-binding protein CbpA